MIKESLLKTVNVVLANRGRKEIDDVESSTNLRSDIGFDSLDLAEFTVRIEAEYGIDVFEDGIVNTIGEIVEKLDSKDGNIS